MENFKVYYGEYNLQHWIKLILKKRHRVIKCRNRVAHNTYVNMSVQNDITELCSRRELDCCNVFMQFFILLYIDNIFNETYKYT